MDTQRPEWEAAHSALAAMLSRSEQAHGRLKAGTASHSLLTNRNAALGTALTLVEQALDGRAVSLGSAAVEQARAPLTSLLAKSEKARAKLAQGCWQHTMLSQSIAALRLVIPLLEAGLEAD